MEAIVSEVVTIHQVSAELNHCGAEEAMRHDRSMNEQARVSGTNETQRSDLGNRFETLGTDTECIPERMHCQNPP